MSTSYLIQDCEEQYQFAFSGKKQQRALTVDKGARKSYALYWMTKKEND